MVRKILLLLLLLTALTSPAYSTVPSTVSRMDYVGNGAVDTYAYGYKIFSNTDLLVTVRDDDDVETELVLTTDYTVTGVGRTAGGNVVLVNSSQSWLDADGDLKSGYVLTIRRVRPLTQNTDIRNQGAYYPEIHEDTFDQLIMIEQQQQDELDRSMKLSETTDPADFDTLLPSDIVSNPGATIIVNDDGDGFITGPTADQISSAQSDADAAAQSASDAASNATTALNATSSVIYLWGATVGGTADAITLTPSPAILSYQTGYRFAFKATGTNTTAVTVNISALGAKSIKTLSGAALTVGEIVSGQVYSMTYDGTNFVIHELGTVEDGAITNAKVNASAAIAYSKLNVAASITRTDIATGYGLVPQGAIIMWSGTIATIPTGWELSDGTCTITCPDLRDKFIIGATSDDSGVAKTNVTGSLTASGGAATATLIAGNIPPLPVTMDSCDNNSGAGTGSAAVECQTPNINSTISGLSNTYSNLGVTASSFSILDPYYALAFIIKN